MSTPRSRSVDERLELIRSLLAKAESTGFGAEADAFNRKAAELMARYAIDDSALWAAAPAAERAAPVETILVLQRPYLPQKALLVHTVAESLGCQAIRFVDRAAAGTERVAVVGFPAEVALVETLVTSLLVQISVAAAAAQPRGLTSAASSSWRRSFLVGFTEVVGERLREARAREVAASEPVVVVGDRPTSVAVVLADRGHEVRAEVRRRYPRLQTTRVSVGSSADGGQRGRAAGRRADLGQRRVRPRRSLT